MNYDADTAISEHDCLSDLGAAGDGGPEERDLKSPDESAEPRKVVPTEPARHPIKGHRGKPRACGGRSVARWQIFGQDRGRERFRRHYDLRWTSRRVGPLPNLAWG